MRTLFKLALLVTATCGIFGCAHNYYNIPQETLEKKVKIIGIAPFFIDGESDVKHPEKEAIVTLIQGFNEKNQKELIARLRATGIFYAVRPVDGEPARLFAGLVASRERRDDAGIIYNKYFYKRDELKRLLADNGLDAVMFVTISGLTRQGKVYASNYLSYTDTDFNYLALSAQMLDRDGATIWEYPNFRQSSLSYPMFFSLQYPDFDEAAANLSEKVDVKFKTVAGVKAAFAKLEASKLNKGQQVSTLYAKQYNEMLSLLQTYQPLFAPKKENAPPVPGTEPVPVTAPAPVSGAVSPAATPKAAALQTSGPAAPPASSALSAPAGAPARFAAPEPVMPSAPAVAARPVAAASSVAEPAQIAAQARPIAAPERSTAAAPAAASRQEVSDGFPSGDIIAEEPPAK